MIYILYQADINLETYKNRDRQIEKDRKNILQMAVGSCREKEKERDLSAMY